MTALSDLITFLSSLSLMEWSYLVISFICLVPVTILYRMYRRSGVFENIIFAGVFLSLSLSIFSVVIAKNTNILLFWQLRHTFLNTTFLFLFIHLLRLYWEKYPRILTLIGIGWFIMLETLILFWQPMLGERTAVLFWELSPHSIDLIDNPRFGAGIALNGKILLYSTHHPLIGYAFYFFITCIFLYCYVSVKPANPTTRIVRAKNLWLLSDGCVFSATFLLITWPFTFTADIATILTLMALILISWVSIRLPESMLLSHIQIHRALSLYKLVQKMTENGTSPETVGMEKLVDYIKSIPPEIRDAMREP